MCNKRLIAQWQPESLPALGKTARVKNQCKFRMPNNLWTEAVFLCVSQPVSYVNRKAKHFTHFKLLAKSQVIQREIH